VTRFRVKLLGGIVLAVAWSGSLLAVGLGAYVSGLVDGKRTMTVLDASRALKLHNAFSRGRRGDVSLAVDRELRADLIELADRRAHPPWERRVLDSPAWPTATPTVRLGNLRDRMRLRALTSHVESSPLTAGAQVCHVLRRLDPGYQPPERWDRGWGPP